MSSDFFNIFTDKEIRGKAGFFKNVDDVLTTARSIQELEERLRTLFTVCRNRNMKLAPSKFQLGRKVIYGGTLLEAGRQYGDSETGVYMSPTQEKLEAFFTEIKI